MTVRSKQAIIDNQAALDELITSRMDNYDVAPLNSRAIRLGPGIAESDVDGMTINSVGPLAAGRTAEGR